MKLLNASSLHCVTVIGTLLALPVEGSAATTTTGSNQSGDPGWPREKYSNGTRLIIYQPQVDDWKNFQELSWRMAVWLTPKGGKEVVGVVEMKGNTDVDNFAKIVMITNPQVTGTYFPSLDPATAERMQQLFKNFVPPTITISLHRSNRWGGGGDRFGGGGFGGRGGGGFKGSTMKINVLSQAPIFL